SRDAMDIEGMGESLIRQLIAAELVQSPADIYRLTEEKLLQLERMGKKSAENILKAIEQSRSKSLSNLIFGLGIRHVGASAAELLADEFGSMDAIADAGLEQLEHIEGIGPVIAEAITEYFDNKENRNLITALKRAGLQMTGKSKVSPKKGL